MNSKQRPRDNDSIAEIMSGDYNGYIRGLRSVKVTINPPDLRSRNSIYRQELINEPTGDYTE